MKKLIIAAGIAAATMASFGASATDVYSAPSTASVNTIVKSASSMVVSATDQEISLDDFLKKDQSIGSFAVSFNGADVENYTDILVEKIHAHGYPADFKIKLTGGATSCEVNTGLSSSVVNISGKGVTDTCAFSLADASNIVVKTNQITTGNVAGADAGTKTITAQFRAYHA